MKGYMYILKCFDQSYYTGSTKDFDKRLKEHKNGKGANHTRKNLPVELIYYEEYSRIDEAFYREKQIQGWSRKKKEALMKGKIDELVKYSRNYSQYGNTLTLPQAQCAAINDPSTGSGSGSGK